LAICWMRISAGNFMRPYDVEDSPVKTSMRWAKMLPSARSRNLFETTHPKGGNKQKEFNDKRQRMKVGGGGGHVQHSSKKNYPQKGR
jgi:hypothetical protein